MFRLENWSYTSTLTNRFLAPENHTISLIGERYIKGVYEKKVITSEVVLWMVDKSGLTAQTKSGSFYVLGKIHEDFAVEDFKDTFGKIRDIRLASGYPLGRSFR